MALALIAATLVAGTSPSQALTTVTLRVVIEEVRQEGCTDTLDGSDFYADISIAGEPFRHGPIDDQDEIVPNNWTSEKLLDVNASSPASVVIDIRDDDDTFNFDDDICDINPNPGTALNLRIDGGGSPTVSARLRPARRGLLDVEDAERDVEYPQISDRPGEADGHE